MSIEREKARFGICKNVSRIAIDKNDKIYKHNNRAILARKNNEIIFSYTKFFNKLGNAYILAKTSNKCLQIIFENIRQFTENLRIHNL